MKAQHVLIGLLVFLLGTGMVYGETDSVDGSRVNAAGTRISDNEVSSSSENQNTPGETEITENSENIVYVKKCKVKSKGKRWFSFSNGKRRSEKPVQVQLLLTGGDYSRYSFGPGAGIHLGYQVSKLVYVGLTSQTSYDRDQYERDVQNYGYDEHTYLGQKGVTRIGTDTSSHQLAEIRFFPFEFGLYFSGGVAHLGAEKSTFGFRKRDRTVGDNDYTDTGLEATLEYAAWSGPVAGIGFNHVFENGFSLGAGFDVGLALQKPEVTVTSTGTVSEADLELWKDQIESNEARIPGQFHFAFGFTF